MTYKCQCLLAGYCDRHQTRKSIRDWQLCQGINCSTETAEKYRQLWDDRAAITLDATSATITTMPRESVATSKTYDPIPRDQWTTAANLIATLATAEDRGVGDTIKRELGRAGKVYQAAFKLLTGHACTGCSFRQSKWNQLYPY